MTDSLTLVSKDRLLYLLKVEKAVLKVIETGGVYEQSTIPSVGDYGVDNKAFSELLQIL